MDYAMTVMWVDKDAAFVCNEGGYMGVQLFNIIKVIVYIGLQLLKTSIFMD